VRTPHSLSLPLPARRRRSEPLKRSLADPNAYVRRTGVVGVLKLHHLAPDVVKDAAMVDTLYAMLHDVDSQVRRGRRCGWRLSGVGVATPRAAELRRLRCRSSGPHCLIATAFSRRVHLILAHSGA
jgi:non-SMC mitotic condensation complex subunit 1